MPRAPKLTEWQKQDARRTKPRVSVVMTPEAREMARVLEAERVQSFSQLVEALIRAEFKKVKRDR